jgi:hypothetical protein
MGDNKNQKCKDCCCRYYGTYQGNDMCFDPNSEHFDGINYCTKFPYPAKPITIEFLQDKINRALEQLDHCFDDFTGMLNLASVNKVRKILKEK